MSRNLNNHHSSNLQKHLSDLILLQRFAMSTTKCHYDDDEALTLPLPPSLSPYLVILAPRDLFAKHIFLCRNVTHTQNRMCFEVCFIPLADFFFVHVSIPIPDEKKSCFVTIGISIRYVMSVCLKMTHFPTGGGGGWRDGDDKAEWNTAEPPSDAFQTQV